VSPVQTLSTQACRTIIDFASIHQDISGRVAVGTSTSSSGRETRSLVADDPATADVNAARMAPSQGNRHQCMHRDFVIIQTKCIFERMS